MGIKYLLKYCLIFVLSFLYISPVFAQTTIYTGSLEKNLDTGEIKVNSSAGPSASVVKTIQIDGTTTLAYVHSDHLGSTSLVTDDKGNKVEEYQYYPYGETANLEPNTYNLEPVSDRLYTGQRQDTDIDLYFYNARYYNPTTGKFLSADKAEGPNRYAYVNNNPVMRNDPSGYREAEEDDKKDIDQNKKYANQLNKNFGINIPDKDLLKWDQDRFKSIQTSVEHMINKSRNNNLFTGVTFTIGYNTNYRADSNPSKKTIDFSAKYFNFGKDTGYVLAHEMGHLFQPGLELGVNEFSRALKKDGQDFGTFPSSVKSEEIEKSNAKIINENSHILVSLSSGEYGLSNAFEGFAEHFAAQFYPEQFLVYQPSKTFKSGEAVVHNYKPIGDGYNDYFTNTGEYFNKIMNR